MAQACCTSTFHRTVMYHEIHLCAHLKLKQISQEDQTKQAQLRWKESSFQYSGTCMIFLFYARDLLHVSQRIKRPTAEQVQHILHNMQQSDHPPVLCHCPAQFPFSYAWSQSLDHGHTSHSHWTMATQVTVTGPWPHKSVTKTWPHFTVTGPWPHK